MFHFHVEYVVAIWAIL